MQLATTSRVKPLIRPAKKSNQSSFEDNYLTSNNNNNNTNTRSAVKNDDSLFEQNDNKFVNKPQRKPPQAIFQHQSSIQSNTFNNSSNLNNNQNNNYRSGTPQGGEFLTSTNNDRNNSIDKNNRGSLFNESSSRTSSPPKNQTNVNRDSPVRRPSNKTPEFANSPNETNKSNRPDSCPKSVVCTPEKKPSRELNRQGLLKMTPKERWKWAVKKIIKGESSNVSVNTPFLIVILIYNLSTKFSHGEIYFIYLGLNLLFKYPSYFSVIDNLHDII